MFIVHISSGGVAERTDVNINEVYRGHRMGILNTVEGGGHESPGDEGAAAHAGAALACFWTYASVQGVQHPHCPGEGVSSLAAALAKLLRGLPLLVVGRRNATNYSVLAPWLSPSLSLLSWNLGSIRMRLETFVTLIPPSSFWYWLFLFVFIFVY